MIRKILFIFLVVWLSAPAAPAAGAWVKQLTAEATPLNSVYFIDQDTGWAVGDDGVILKTADHGNNWTAEASNTTEDLYGVFFTSAAKGWAVGGSRTVVSYDGTAWTPAQVTAIDSANFSFTSVFFTSSAVGYATSGLYSVGSQSAFRNLFKTTDGGISWTGQQVSNTAEAPAILNYLYSVYFSDANNGWAVGADSAATPAGKAFKTANAGATWEAVDFGVYAMQNVQLRDAYFVDANTGFIVGGVASTEAHIYQITNGGATWAKTTYSPLFLRAVDGASASKVWASDRASILEYDGASWSESTPLSQGYFNGLDFPDAFNGWAVGGQLSVEADNAAGRRYIYKYVVEPNGLYTSPEVVYLEDRGYTGKSISVAGNNIHSNALLTLEAGATGLTLESYVVTYDSVNRRYKIDAKLSVGSSREVAVGAYRFTITNPNDNTSAEATFRALLSYVQRFPGSAPPIFVAIPKISDMSQVSSFKVVIGSEGGITQSGLRALGPIRGYAADVELELLVYRQANRQIAFRRKFFADPSGYTEITLQKVTDLGVDLSEGIYQAIVRHPNFGKIGEGVLVVHYRQ